jgi:ERCC4-type nuclease
MTILVDVEEDRSPVPRCLEALGSTIELARLPVGDYVVADDVAVERKTVKDLHASLVSGRLWSQLFALRRAMDRPYLVIEGFNLDGGRVSHRGVRGALLAIVESGVAVLRSSDSSDTALWLHLLARRANGEGDRRDRRRGRRRMAVSS